jgi:flavodoxin
MRALVIYDSAFGNTERVARAIGEALSAQAEVEVLRATDAGPEQLLGLDVLVVGSPTQKFQPLPAVKELLEGIPSQGLRGVRVAAFDTRINMEEIEQPVGRFLGRLVAALFGYAAEPIADRLKRKGGELVVAPEGFFVEDTEGPLKDGELERAAAWARQIIETA